MLLHIGSWFGFFEFRKLSGCQEISKLLYIFLETGIFGMFPKIVKIKQIVLCLFTLLWFGAIEKI